MKVTRKFFSFIFSKATVSVDENGEEEEQEKNLVYTTV